MTTDKAEPDPDLGALTQDERAFILTMLKVPHDQRAQVLDALRRAVYGEAKKQ